MSQTPNIHADWRQLENDISTWLEGFSSNHIQYRNSHQAIIGFPTDGFRSDGMLTDGNVLIAVEIEAGQTHPDTNVGKYWFLQTRYKRYEKIILLHIYTPHFNSYGWRKKLAEFYIEEIKKLKLPVEYVQLDYRNSIDYQKTLINVKRIMKEKIKAHIMCE